MSLLLPLLLAALLLYWIVNSNGSKPDTGARGQTLQIMPFSTPTGTGVARRMADYPYDRTLVYIFNDAGSDLATDPTGGADPLASTAINSPKQRKWPEPTAPETHVTAFAGPVGCSMVNDRDLVVFYAAAVSPTTGIPSKSIGYLYRDVTKNKSEPVRLVVDADILPEVFVQIPAALADDNSPPPPPAPTPDSIPASTPTTPTAPPAPAPAPGSPPAAEPPADPGTAPPDHPVMTNAPPAAPPVPAPRIWAFGRSSATSADRRDRLCALELQGDTIRLRSVSTGSVQINAASFLMTAVPMDDVVHLFWRQTTENNLPGKTIFHAVYDGHEFRQLNGIQDAPAGFFTTTREGARILITVLRPIDPVVPSAAERYRGRYQLEVARLDCSPEKSPAAPQPPVLHWVPVPGIDRLDNFFDLTVIQTLDGRSRQLLVRGSPRGQDEISLVTMPPEGVKDAIWTVHPFLTSNASPIPDADKLVVFLLIGMLGLFGGVMLVAWLRPWRWFNAPPRKE